MMKSLLSMVLFLLALGAGPIAQAQTCGSGGGATVCLTATGTPDNIKLTWTVSGAVTGIQVYRDTDSDTNGRSRLAILAASVYWDSGYTGNHGSGLFNRSNGTQAYPDVVTGIVNAAK